MERLSSESSISLSRWVAADNMDLSNIFQEFEAFYELKYQRAPRMVRPANNEDAEENEKQAARARRKSVNTTRATHVAGLLPSLLSLH
jgi:katanin p60 ATPase-containing subunit A1